MLFTNHLKSPVHIDIVFGIIFTKSTNMLLDFLCLFTFVSFIFFDDFTSTFFTEFYHAFSHTSLCF